MSVNEPSILALDFDGVICDGLFEYFQTAWRTYCQIWTPPHLIPPDNLAPIFYRLRPVVETGWEMPLVLRALILGISEEKILHDWQVIAKQLLLEEAITAAEIATKVDQVRDEWIARDIDNWLAQHRFYPGVIDKLRSLLSDHSIDNDTTQPYIVTTKEGRFVKKLLEQQNINLSEERIFGKENKRPKYEILRELSGINQLKIWFVEDRLKTLELVEKQADLQHISLYLANWGYNTEKSRESIKNNQRIKLLSLSQFANKFSAWN